MNNSIRLPRYIPIPVSLLSRELSDSALIVYGLLLARYLLSQINDFRDEYGEVYILYAQEDLAGDIGKTSRSVMRAMKELEAAGLIRTRRGGPYAANRIYVTVPSCEDDRNVTLSYDRNVTPDTTELSPDTRQNCHTSISKSISKSNNTSQYRSSSPSYTSPNNGYGGGKRGGGKTDSGMFAPIPDYENCDYGYGY